MRVCSFPGCSTQVVSGQCAEHRRVAWRSSTTPARQRGARLQALRQQLFEREPLCRACRAEGRIREATIRDHVVPLAEGGQDSEDNTQPLCQACSDAKTQAESRRGRNLSKITGKFPLRNRLGASNGIRSWG